MFEGAVPHLHISDEATEHAAAAFGELVRNVEMAAAAGAIIAAQPSEVAQQIWSTVHGAVALELQDLVLTPRPRGDLPGHRGHDAARPGRPYFTKYQFSGLMLSVGLCGLTPRRLSATSVRL